MCSDITPTVPRQADRPAAAVNTAPTQVISSGDRTREHGQSAKRTLSATTAGEQRK
jgi:hypothetical protein